MNLLPQTDKDAIRHGLKLRFIIVANVFISVSMIIGTIMLLPPFFLTKVQFDNAVSDNSSTRVEDAELTKSYLLIPNEIESKLELMGEAMTKTSALDVFSKIVSPISSEITLKSITFRRQAEKSKQNMSVVISGISKDRESLVDFSDALNKLEGFESVEVPVGSFTKDRDVPFSMNLTIKNESN
ncbi:MAG TPA: hypothetical protein VJB58_00200 [Candidatus Paceibacterota bacterium]